MAIYRGPGGSGDATADQASTAQLALQYATNSANSATASAASAGSRRKGPEIPCRDARSSAAPSQRRCQG